MFIFIIVFSVLSGRFIYIQATGQVQDVSLIDLANKKRQASAILQSERGKIYDNNGMVLAFDRPTYRLYAIVDSTYTIDPSKPLHITDATEAAKKLSPLIDVEESVIKATLTNGLNDEDTFQVEFGVDGKNITQETKEAIEALKISGINFIKESMRYYPNGMFASHIIGFARQDPKTEVITGVTGIENNQDDILAGEDGAIKYLRDRYNKKLLRPHEVITKPEDGNDIHLTIDQKIQTLLEDVMSEVDDTYEPEKITAVVMNPNTGEILAMSNRPSYNPNNPVEVDNWYNDVISTPIEAGSTMKMFTWAAAIDAGVYDENEQFLSGKYVINEKVQPVNDHNEGRGWGNISFDEGFTRSSNVGAARLMWEKLGSESFLNYLQRFDLDKKTEVDLPGEVAGKIQYDWPRDKLSTAFGQGSTVTPIQQMKAATAIANEGKMMRPYVIKKITNPQTGEIIESKEPHVVGEPIKKETADKMLELLDTVVNTDIGTGKRYRLEDYTTIGKTGTAQIPNPDGGYITGSNNNVYSFLGMAPKDDPQMMMHVSISQPKNLKENEFGADAVAFIYKNVMENGLHYLNIEPDKETTNHLVELKTLPNLVDEKTTVVKERLDKENVNGVIIGNGDNIVQLNINADEPFYTNQRVIAITDKPTIPSLKDWSKRDVLTLANMLEIDVQFTGHGYVTEQSIKRGTEIKEDMVLEITLESSLDE